MRTELAPASTGGSDRGRPRGLPAARRWTVLLLLGGLASCVAPDGGTGSGPAGGPAGAAAGGLVDGGRREPLPPVSAPMVAEPQYVRFKAEETRLVSVVDDGRNVYLEFRGPVAADLEFFDQDGRSLPGVSAGRVVAVPGLHPGLLVRDGERASFAAPNPRAAGLPPPPLPAGQDHVEARARLENRGGLMQAMQRALDAARGRMSADAAARSSSVGGPPGAILAPIPPAPQFGPYAPTAGMASPPAAQSAPRTHSPVSAYLPGQAYPARSASPASSSAASAASAAAGTPRLVASLSLAPLALANASTAAPEQGLIRIFFASASRAIVAPEDGLGMLLKEAARADEIRVTGFTDAIGSPATNDALARARAEAVVQILLRRGIPRERIFSSAIAGGAFIADNATDRGRALNRRAEVVLLKNGAPLVLASGAAGWR